MTFKKLALASAIAMVPTVGFSQMVLARELTLEQIREIHQALDPERCKVEFFIHGALCVAYSGQCYISHAHTGRSANRGDCSQACRLPYHVVDSQGRFVAHDKHVLSMKDNNQSANLAALIDAGVRSFKIEGRYKDMGYVKNITAHYRRLFDELIESREGSAFPLARASSGRTTFTFTPDPNQNFNREFTDYFVNGRKEDIGAFDSPKNPGQPIGFVTKVGTDSVDLALDRSMVAQVFRALPTRWQEVLWYTEVEQLRPQSVAPFLGMSANAVAALSHRAREGFRRA